MMFVVKCIKSALEMLVITPGKVNKGVCGEHGRPEQREEESGRKAVGPG